MCSFPFQSGTFLSNLWICIFIYCEFTYLQIYACTPMAFATSLGLPHLVFKMLLALPYPSTVNGSPSIHVRALGTRSSFRYDSLAIWLISAISISVSNCPQSLCQSRKVPWNFVITNLGSFVLLPLPKTLIESPPHFFRKWSVNWYKIDIGRFLKPKRSVNLEFMAVTSYLTICCQVIFTCIKL